MKPSLLIMSTYGHFITFMCHESHDGLDAFIANANHNLLCLHQGCIQRGANQCPSP